MQDDDKIRYIRYKCSVGDSWANGFAGYKLIMLLATIILVCVHIKTVSTKDKRHSPYKDLIVSSCGMAFSFAAFGLVFIDDPGLEYALVSLVLIVMSYLILGSMFALKVSYHANVRYSFLSSPAILSILSVCLFVSLSVCLTQFVLFVRTGIFHSKGLFLFFS